MKPFLKLYKADLLKGAPKIPDDSVDLVVTSPPYKREDGWSLALMQALPVVLDRVMRPGSRLFFNFGQLRESFSRAYTSRDAVACSGLVPGQTIAWAKSVALPTWRRQVQEVLDGLNKALDELRRNPPDNAPYIAADLRCKALAMIANVLEGPGEVLQHGHYQAINKKSPTLNYCWEPVFSFYKPPEPGLDRLSIGCAFADKTNLKRGTRGAQGDVHCIGDVWFIPYETTGATKKKASTKTKHAYSFPEELVKRCIKVSGIARGSTVYDPFMGSGTVAVVAKRLGMNVIGTDIDDEALRTTRTRWGAEKVGQHGKDKAACVVDM